MIYLVITIWVLWLATAVATPLLSWLALRAIKTANRIGVTEGLPYYHSSKRLYAASNVVMWCMLALLVIATILNAVYFAGQP